MILSAEPNLFDTARVDYYPAKLSGEALGRMRVAATAYRKLAPRLFAWLEEMVKRESCRRRLDKPPIEAFRPVMPLYVWSDGDLADALACVHVLAKMRAFPPMAREFFEAVQDRVVQYAASRLRETSKQE